MSTAPKHVYTEFQDLFRRAGLTGPLHQSFRKMCYDSLEREFRDTTPVSAPNDFRACWRAVYGEVVSE